MDILLKPPNPNSRKRKRKSKATVTKRTPENSKLDTTGTTLTPETIRKNDGEPLENTEKYPILNNQELVSKFLTVPMTNNQKGRIRQAVRDSLQGTSNVLVPEIIHNKIQSILNSSESLTDSQLRRIRILYNLLKTALKDKKLITEPVNTKSKSKKKKIIEGDKKEENVTKDKDVADKKEPKEQLKKIRGPKRYIVFLGNLPLDIDKEKIMQHFAEMNEHIKDIRIPNASGKKSAIAYLELSNEPSYEFALSKHHSMLGNKRINVLYTAPKKGKVTKANAKSKSAKLIALQKSGKLVGSLPLAKKRSQRRLKMKQAQAKLAQENAS